VLSQGAAREFPAARPAIPDACGQGRARSARVTSDQFAVEARGERLVAGERKEVGQRA